MSTFPLIAMRDLTDWMMLPARIVAAGTHALVTSPDNPFADTPQARLTAAGCDLFERLTRHYGKPDFGIKNVDVGGHKVPIVEEVVYETPFCRLVRFRRNVDDPNIPAAVRDAIAKQPKTLLVAPLSGHYATLLRGTAAEMARHNDVFIADWKDASTVPCADGKFDFGDYVKHVRSFLTNIGAGANVIAVCQPSVAVLAAVALMNQDKDPAAPRSMVLMGGPIDTRINPQAPNVLASSRPLSWFRENMTDTVPFGHYGFGRQVCPGFLMQLGWVNMNLQRHLDAYRDYYFNLLSGASSAVEAHRKFYDEYNAVMDLPAEYYLQTIDIVFQRHLLAKGELVVDGRRIDLSAITRTALMTVEGEKDDITGVGQCDAARMLLTGLPESRKLYHLEPEAGHYGIFNGSRWRNNIAPRIVAFQLANNRTA